MSWKNSVETFTVSIQARVWTVKKKPVGLGQHSDWEQLCT